MHLFPFHPMIGIGPNDNGTRLNAFGSMWSNPAMRGFTKRKRIEYGTEISSGNLQGFPKLLSIGSLEDVSGIVGDGGGLAVTGLDDELEAPVGMYPTILHLKKDLKHYYKLDEASGVAVDSYGSVNLTDNNTVGSGTGKISGARDFTLANTEYFSGNITQVSNQDFSIAFWINLKSLSGTQFYAAKHDNYYIYGSGGVVNFEALTSGGYVTQGLVGGLTTGVWYYLLINYKSATKTLEWSLDGAALSSAVLAHPVSQNNNGFYLGSLIGTLPADCLMDEVALWQRTNNQAQVDALYNGGAGLSLDDYDASSANQIILRTKLDLSSTAVEGDPMGYLFYDPDCETIEDKPAVVSNGYALFMPLEEDPSGTAPQMLDWVTGQRIGTSAGSMTSGDLVAGVVGNRIDFDGIDDKITLPLATSATDNFSFGFIVETSDISDTGTLFFNGGGWGSSNGYGILHSGSGYLEAYWEGVLANAIPHSFTLTNDTPASVVVSRESGTATMYVNGVAVGTGTATPQIPATRTMIGWWGDFTPNYSSDKIEEVWVANVPRSSNWFEYENTDNFNNSDTFSLGDEELAFDGQFFTEYKVITIDNAFVDADLTDFPVYVPISADADIGAAIDDEGCNIRFTTSDGVTVLNYERTSFHVAEDMPLTDNNTVGSAAGKFGTAADLDPTSGEFLSVADNEILSSGNVDTTWLFWAYLDAETDSYLAYKGNGGGQDEIEIMWIGYFFRFRCWGGASFANQGLVTSSGIHSSGSWKMVVVKHDYTNGVIGISVDGEAYNTAAHTHGIYDSGQAFRLGSWYGMMSNVAVLKGYCLTNDDITELWNGGNGYALPDWPLRLQKKITVGWILDEVSGDRASFNFAAGEFFVKVPTVTTAADATIRCYYRAGVGIDGQDKAGTWNDDFVAVYHLEEDPSSAAPQVKDSTGNGNHGTSSGSMTSGDLVAGQVGNGLDFDGADDLVQFAIPEIGATAAFTIEAVVNIKSGQPNFQRIWSAGFASYTEAVLWTNHGQNHLEIRPANVSPTLDAGAIADDTFHSVQFTDDSGNIAVYVDGALADSDPAAYTASNINGGFNSDGHFAIGGQFGGGNYGEVKIGELRLSGITRPAEWLKFTHHNLFEADSEISFGAAQSIYDAGGVEIVMAVLLSSRVRKDRQLRRFRR